jgi:hypothetical protein
MDMDVDECKINVIQFMDGYIILMNIDEQMMEIRSKVDKFKML